MAHGLDAFLDPIRQGAAYTEECKCAHFLYGATL